MIVEYLIGIAILTIGFLLTILVALKYFGLFDKINVGTGSAPYDYSGRQIVYRIDYGSYNQSSPIFTELCSILPPEISTNIPTFGVYLHKHDNDHEWQQIKRYLRPERLFNTEYVFMVGAILARGQHAKSWCEESTLDLLQKKGYRYAQLPNQVDNVVYAKFAFRGMLSVVLASYRVYAAIDHYLQEHRLCAYPKLEIYVKDNIYYILPLSQQNQFIKLISNALQIEHHSNNKQQQPDRKIQDKFTIGQDSLNDEENDQDEPEPTLNDHSDHSVESNSSYEMLD